MSDGTPETAAHSFVLPAPRPAASPAEAPEPTVGAPEPVAEASEPAAELRLTFGDRHIVAALAVFALALFTLATRLRLNELPWGDEPHYLIISQAIAKYHTFDPTAVYASLDYQSFYPRQIDPHLVRLPDGTTVPLHNVGGPLLWALPFMLWGRAGAAMVIVLISVLIVVNIYYLLRELGIVKAYATVVTAFFVLGTPIYMYASMQFVDPMGALVVIFAVRAVINKAPGPLRVAFVSAAVGYLPWIHGRFIIFTIVLGVLLVARVAADPTRRSALSYVAAMAPMALLIFGLEVFNLVVFGTLNPAPGNSNNGDGLFQISPVTGLSGLLFDRQAGLLPHFPVLALALPGLMLALRRTVLPTHLILAVVAGTYVLAMSTFWAWWAGFSPPARFLSVITPLLAYYVAVTLQRVHSWIITSVALLATFASFVVAVTGDIYTIARFTESGGRGVNPLGNYLGEKLHLGRFANLFPTNRVADAGDVVGFVGWFLLLAAGSWLVWLIGRRRPAARTPLTPLATLFPAAPSWIFRPNRIDAAGERGVGPT